ncbi:MAG: hypothetical protein D6689_04240, partial [Deltaproteobacteria bacterium]
SAPAAAPTAAVHAPAAPAAAPTAAASATAPTAAGPPPAAAAHAASPAVAPPAARPADRAPPAPAAFDPDAGARAALAAATDCVAPERRAGGVTFGASLVYRASDGLSHRVYFGRADALAPAERACIARALVGISAGAPPPRNTVVVHTFTIDDRGGRVRARAR